MIFYNKAKCYALRVPFPPPLLYISVSFWPQFLPSQLILSKYWNLSFFLLWGYFLSISFLGALFGRISNMSFLANVFLEKLRKGYQWQPVVGLGHLWCWQELECTFGGRRIYTQSLYSISLRNKKIIILLHFICDSHIKIYRI